MKYFKAPKFQFKFTPDLKTRSQKRPFIVPSRFGIYFGLGILVLLSLAYTYANQLIYLIAFFYSSILFIAMHLTNNNLKSVEVSEFFIRNFFQDESGRIKIIVRNQHSKYFARFIQIDIPDYKIQSVIEEISPNSSKAVELNFIPQSRGRYLYPKIVLSCKFPFNLFYSWKRLSWVDHFFTYPAREGTSEPPYTTGEELNKKLNLSSPLTMNTSDSFLGHREYNQFDNYKRIDWKVYARKNKLYVKTFETESSQICFVDINEYLAFATDFDKRIKQLAKWINDAHKGNTLFIVRLKNDEITFLDDRKKVETILEELSTVSIGDLI